MRLNQDHLDWVHHLQKRYRDDRPTRFVPLNNHWRLLDIEHTHLTPSPIDPSVLYIDWDAATDGERATYQQFIDGIIEHALSRGSELLSYLELDVQRALWAIRHVFKRHRVMAPILHGWFSEFTFVQGRLVDRDLTLATLGTHGVACWNTDKTGAEIYVPREETITSDEVHKEFVAKISEYEEREMWYTMEALVACATFRNAERRLQGEIVQALRDVHAMRLIELLASRKTLPVYWAEDATQNFPARSKICTTYKVQRTLIKRADPGAWKPLASAKHSGSLDLTWDFSAGGWLGIWASFKTPDPETVERPDIEMSEEPNEEVTEGPQANLVHETVAEPIKEPEAELEKKPVSILIRNARAESTPEGSLSPGEVRETPTPKRRRRAPRIREASPARHDERLVPFREISPSIRPEQGLPTRARSPVMHPDRLRGLETLGPIRSPSLDDEHEGEKWPMSDRRSDREPEELFMSGGRSDRETRWPNSSHNKRGNRGGRGGRGGRGFRGSRGGRWRESRRRGG